MGLYHADLKHYSQGPLLLVSPLLKEVHKQKLFTQNRLWSILNIMSKISVLKGPPSDRVFKRQLTAYSELKFSFVSLEQVSDLSEPFTQPMLNPLNQTNLS